MGGKRLKINRGDKYGRLTIISECDPRVYSGHPCRVFTCRCDCGTVKEFLLSKFRTGHTTSCGCYQKEVLAKRNSTHNLGHNKIYRVWISMKNRCYLEKDKDYDNYGGRGITICDEWKNNVVAFYNWAITHQYKKGLTIDRINNNGNYEPDNCRWATTVEQSRNKRNNVKIKIDGDVKCLSEWCEILHVKYDTARSRIRAGYEINRVFNI